MILDTQKAMRVVQQLPFCYLCGEPLTGCRNDDHVPPSTIFLDSDRNFPLTLPTHVKCNGDQSQDDQAIGQLIGILHGMAAHPRHNKLTVNEGQFEENTEPLNPFGT